MLGVSLGLLFTPCAGPVIARRRDRRRDAGPRRSRPSSITLAYGLGAGLVLLGVAIAAQRGMNLQPVRAHAPVVRRALGVAVLGVAVLMVFGVDKDLQTRVPEYTRALQRLEESAAARTASSRSSSAATGLAQRGARSTTTARRPSSRASRTGSTRRR